MDFYLTPHISKGLLLCVSGGSDSRALMEAVARWPKRSSNIQVLSVNHATRLETLDEARAVAARARVLGFESHVLSLNPEKKMDESSLRARRYKAIWSLARELSARAIAVAHTEDDQAESLVMDLMGQGGGPQGAGMLPVTQMPQGLVLRPLLSFSRAYLIALLTELEIYDYIQDPTNKYSEGRRVQVRHFLSLHKAPRTRLAQMALKRRKDFETMRHLWEEQVDRVGEQVQVRLDAHMPEVIKFQALKTGLAEFLPGQDLRTASVTLQKIASASKPGQSYDLPGCVAEVRALSEKDSSLEVQYRLPE